MDHNPKEWCNSHEDFRIFTGQTTGRGEVLDVYADEWTPNCRHYAGTGKFVADGHEPRIAPEKEKGEGHG